MMIFKKYLHRRTVLRGLGATLALPLLDSMVPALTALQNTAAKPARRFGAIYVGNGMNVWQWRPKTEGSAFELTPILQPLAAFRDRLLIVSGLCNSEADARVGEGGGDHSRGQAAFLTGAHAKKTQGADVEAGISMDQIVAKEVGHETQLPSLELALEANDVVGGCEAGVACVYTSTISWHDAKTPMPVTTDPRAVFERLFGASGSTDPRIRRENIETDRSILDWVTRDLARLQRTLDAGDRSRVEEYVQSIRDVEQRLQKAEEQSDLELPSVDQPAGIPGSFEEYAKIMFDMMALAYQADLTRVSTLIMGRELSIRTYPEVGVPEPHHPVSHHQGRAEQLEKLARINLFHITLFAHFLEKLRSTRDGDGSLLDHSIILYGSGLGNPDVHDHHGLPIALVGGGAGQLKGGRHLRFKDHTPLANLHVTVLEKMGIPMERLGDSTGKLDLLQDV